MRKTHTQSILLSLLLVVLSLPSWGASLESSANDKTDHVTYATQFPLTVQDARGPRIFKQAPKRVAVLTWSLVETVVELGIEPIAIADTVGYNEWVVNPELPASVENLGTRQEPNIDKLRALKPDLILVADMQVPLARSLERIAPVLAFKIYDEDHNNLEISKSLFMTLGELFDRKEQALKKLAEVDQRISELKATLNKHFKGQLPKVTTVRFNNTSAVWVYGKNSMPEYALNRLGLETAWTLPSTQWGVVQKRVKDLNRIQDGIVLHFEPFKDAKRLFGSKLWKTMPFVKQGQFESVESTWTYGGPISILYLAEVLTDALIKVQPNTEIAQQSQ